jgi:hypothetical protein
MRPAPLAITHIALLATFSTPLAALAQNNRQQDNLTQDEKISLDAISRDPQKVQEAIARLKKVQEEAVAGLKSNNAYARSAPASRSKPLVKAQPDASTTPVDAKAGNKLDTINALIGQTPPKTFKELIAQNQGKPWYEKQYSRCAGFAVLLRQDWQNFSNAAGNECPTDQGKQGAQISYSDDRIANNRAVAIHGTAALMYNSVIGDPPNGFIPYGTSFGAYVTENNLTNSAKAQIKSNADSTSYGGVLELGYVTPGGTSTFRFLGGGSDDNLKRTSSGNAAAEWYPVYDPLNINTPISQPAGIPIILTFTPDLAARYDGATGANQIVPFNNRQQSMRLGPELLLNLQSSPTAPAILANLVASAGYDWYYESYTRKELNWFTTTVTYYIDDAQHIGLSGKYQRGREPLTTGASTNIYTVGLSGKM